MPHPHPTDRILGALLDGRLDEDAAEETRAHVTACARCQLRVGQSDEALHGQFVPTLSVSIDPIVEDHDRSPEHGDLWRLSWDETAVLALVWAADDEQVTVLPTIESASADEWCLLVGPQDIPGLGDFAISVAFETTVPWCVLDAWVGKLVDETSLTNLRSAFRRGTDPGQSRRGVPMASELDERLDQLDRLAETMGDLANAVWADATDSSATPLTFEELEVVGLPPNRELAIHRGATPTPAEADLIEEVTGRRPSGAPIPPELRRAIDRPRRKETIRARARTEHRNEAEVRRALASAAEPALSAARGTAGDAPDYDLVLDRLLNG